MYHLMRRSPGQRCRVGWEVHNNVVDGMEFGGDLRADKRCARTDARAHMHGRNQAGRVLLCCVAFLIDLVGCRALANWHAAAANQGSGGVDEIS